MTEVTEAQSPFPTSMLADYLRNSIADADGLTALDTAMVIAAADRLKALDENAATAAGALDDTKVNP